MRSMSLVRNLVFQYVQNGKKGELTKRIRIIWINEDNSIAFVVKLEGEGSFPYALPIDELEDELSNNGMVRIPDPFARVWDEEKISSNIKMKRDKNWKVIEFLWLNKELSMLSTTSRAAKIKEASERFAIPDYRIKRILKRFWQRGMTKNALILDYGNCGGKGKARATTDKKRGRHTFYHADQNQGINIDEDIQKIIRNSMDIYKKKNKPTIQDTYNYMLETYFSSKFVIDGKEISKLRDDRKYPNYDQFYYWFKKFSNFEEQFLSRHGENNFNLKYRELLSNSTIETFGPGSRYQIDATVADVYLVSSLNRNKVIGRPICYAVMDVFSRMVVGIYVGLEGPSWLGAMMALDNVVADKVKFCAKFDIEITEEEWPCRNLPEAIIADNGEFEGYGPEKLINNLNIGVENTAPYRGDLKGIVERRFRTFNGKIKHMAPGAIEKEYRIRGEEDHRLKAVLNMKEFTKIFILEVLHHNRSTVADYPLDQQIIADGVLPIPIKLWNWGIRNRKGGFNYFPEDIVRLNLLPRANVNISREGIKYHGNYYSTEKAIAERWFVNPKRTSIEIAYDPRNMDYIYIPDNLGRSFEIGNILDKSPFHELSWEEIRYLQELKVEGSKDNNYEEKESDIDTDREIRETIKKAKKEVAKQSQSEPKISNRQKVKNIRNNKIEEKELIRESESFILGQKEPIEGKVLPFEQNDNSVEEKVNLDSSEAESSDEDLMSLILQVRDKSLPKHKE